MFANLIIRSLLIALSLVGIWLAFRSLKAQKRLWKVTGVLGGGLLTLIFGAVAFFGAKGLWALYVPVGEVPDLRVQGTPEQIARGEYLSFVSCNGCHGVDGQRDQPLTGGLDLAAEIPLPLGPMIAANITPAGIIRERSDGELFRLLRYGFNGDNQVSAVMANMPYRALSDEDLVAIIAYLRSREPVESSGMRGSELNFLAAVMTGAGLFPIPEPIHGVVTAPPRGETAEYGRYVAIIGDCVTCHGPDLTGMPPSQLAPDGYPDPRPMAATWTLEQFVQTMRTGVRPTGQALDMPWENAAQMDDQDLAALYAFLTAEP